MDHMDQVQLQDLASDSVNQGSFLQQKVVQVRRLERNPLNEPLEQDHLGHLPIFPASVSSYPWFQV